MKNIEEKREKLHDFLRKMPFPTASMKEIADDKEATMCVSRVEDYDPEDNDVWKLDVNKSFPRGGLNCFNCQSPCVMSNGLYEAFKANTNSPKVICNRCVIEEMKKQCEVLK